MGIFGVAEEFFVLLGKHGGLEHHADRSRAVVEVFGLGDNAHPVPAVARRSDDLVVPRVADYGDIVPRRVTLGHYAVYLLDDGTGGVDEHDSPLPQPLLELPRDAVGADESHRTFGESFRLFGSDGDGALFRKVRHDALIVYESAYREDFSVLFGEFEGEGHRLFDSAAVARAAGDRYPHLAGSSPLFFFLPRFAAFSASSPSTYSSHCLRVSCIHSKTFSVALSKSSG